MREDRNRYSDRLDEGPSGGFDYIPGDEMDREEREERERSRSGRNHSGKHRRGGGTLSLILGCVAVIALLAFLFVLADSGVLAGGITVLKGTQGSESASAGTTVQREAGEEAAAAEASGKAAEEAAAAEASRKAAEEAAAAEASRKAAEEAAAEASRKAAEEKAEAARKKSEEEQAAVAASREAAEQARKEAEEAAQAAADEEARSQAQDHEQEVLEGDYILADSNSRYYSRSEINALTDKELLYAINEIYAREGRIFTTAEYKEYFESKSWYKGTVPADEFDADQDSHFNECERANIKLMVAVAQERGIR